MRTFSKSMVPSDIRWAFGDVVSHVDVLPNLSDDFWPEMVEFDISKSGFNGDHQQFVHQHLTWHDINGEDEIDLTPVEVEDDEVDT